MWFKDYFKNRTIRRNNIKFQKLSNSKKRVVIAKDCLQQINERQIEPDTSIFLEQSFYGINGSLKEELEKGIKCTACAKGSLFLSYVRKVNNFNTNSLTNGYDACCPSSNEMEKLGEIFELEQLHLIEVYFEGRFFLWSNGILEEEHIGSAEKFVEKNTDPEQRLILILNNIIDNNGTFVPEKL